MAADGLIYQQFADHTKDYLVSSSWLLERDEHGRLENEIVYAVIGVDFGGTKSAHSFTLTGFTKGYKQVVVLDEASLQEADQPKTAAG